MLPEPLKSCQFRVIRLFFQVCIKNNWALGQVWKNVCAQWQCWWLGKAYRTPSSFWSSHFFIVTTSAAPRSVIQRSHVYTSMGEKTSEVQRRVRGGWVTFTLFILTAAHLASSRNASSLDGTVSVFCFFFTVNMKPVSIARFWRV